MPEVEFLPIGTEIEGIRTQKEPEELLAIRRAIQMATEAFTRVLANIAPGTTEKRDSHRTGLHHEKPGG